MRYRTIRPLKAARVWLSKSGMLIPGEPHAQKRIPSKQIFSWRDGQTQRIAACLRACDVVNKDLPAGELLLQLSDLPLLVTIGDHQF